MARTVFIEAVRGGGLVFTQGTTASRATGPVPETVHNPDFPYRHNQIKLQTELTLESLRSILEAAGTSFEHVVRAEIYLSDIKYLAGLDEVWERYFPIDPPA
ncbi:MAG: RidA family protein, partial [Dehalococcoidia bacterium]